jgi:phosphoribosylformylglycinamidine synthase
MVRTNTAVLPGADAAVVRIKETRRALAMSLDGNGRYCAANPREGARLIVAEAARNVVCVGARPLAITNCLNFASPERPEVMWSFSEVIDGMAEACLAFNTPVVSGNVSFYNETEGVGILPTPVIGMIGLIEDVRRVVQEGFKRDGDTIALLGHTDDDISISEYAATVRGLSTESMVADGSVPKLSLETELAVQSVCLARLLRWRNCSRTSRVLLFFSESRSHRSKRLSAAVSAGRKTRHTSRNQRSLQRVAIPDYR